MRSLEIPIHERTIAVGLSLTSLIETLDSNELPVSDSRHKRSRNALYADGVSDGSFTICDRDLKI